MPVLVLKFLLFLLYIFDQSSVALASQELIRRGSCIGTSVAVRQQTEPVASRISTPEVPVQLERPFSQVQVTFPLNSHICKSSFSVISQLT